jgi:EH domain-containing protein 1
MPMLDADASTFRVVEELKRMYKSKIVPLESMYQFDDFYSASWGDSDFDSKPQVLLVGMYSTGKTTFIRQMVGKEIPGSRIGPEPSTDKFTIIMHGRDERQIPGNTLALKKDLPYRGLEKFGVSFLVG